MALCGKDTRHGQSARDLFQLDREYEEDCGSHPRRARQEIRTSSSAGQGRGSRPLRAGLHRLSGPFPQRSLRRRGLLKNVPAGKKIALFSTHGSLPGMQLSGEAIEYASVLVAKARLLGTFSCRGKVSMQALEVLGRSPEHEAWTDMAASASTHPDEHDIADARAFAKWVAMQRPRALLRPRVSRRSF